MATYAVVAAALFALTGSVSGAETIATPSSAAGSTTSPTASPTDTATDATPAPVETPTIQEPEGNTYEKLSAKQWRKVAENPGAYAGRSFVVYGQIAQHDDVTGPENAIAYVGGTRHKCPKGACDYPTDTVLTGPDELADLHEADLFEAKITVVGPLTYRTAGGETRTVPHLLVEEIGPHP